MARPLAVLDRLGLVARIIALRKAMEVLEIQADSDEAGAFHCLGAMKLQLVTLESQVRELDRRERATFQARSAA